MKIFRVEYEIQFVTGHLKGLKQWQDFEVPESLLERTIQGFENDIKTGKVIKPVFGGSSYKILNCRHHKTGREIHG